MRTRKMIGSAAALALTIPAILLTGESAFAATDTADGEFTDFAASLEVDASVERELENAWDDLTEGQQLEFLETLRSDPASVFEISETVETVEELAEPADPVSGFQSRAAVKGYLAKDSQTASVIGIPVHTLTNEFKYEADAKKVTRILSCNGWHTGAGVSSSVSKSQYITSGRGTCNITHRMSFLVKGSPVTFNKQHNITTNSGKPTAYVATIRTV